MPVSLPMLNLTESRMLRLADADGYFDEGRIDRQPWSSLRKLGLVKQEYMGRWEQGDLTFYKLTAKGRQYLNRTECPHCQGTGLEIANAPKEANDGE